MLTGNRNSSTKSNRRENNIQGTILNSIKDEDTIQFNFKNINRGLKKKGWGKYKYKLKRLKELKVEIIALAEKNIPWTPNKISIVRKKLKEGFKISASISTATTSSSISSSTAATIIPATSAVTTT
eukprot:15343633-Ditylum_brightwellii.AAC.1